jgi:large conductance mechanosensitive channel
VAEVVIKYGAFITNVFDFMVVSFSVFLVIKAINQMKRKDAVEEPTAEASNADKLLAEIRDALKKTE